MRSYPAIEKARELFYARQIRLRATDKDVQDGVGHGTGTLITIAERKSITNETLRDFCVEWDQDLESLISDIRLIERLTVHSFEMSQTDEREKSSISQNKHAIKYSTRVRVRPRYTCTRKRNRSRSSIKTERKTVKQSPDSRSVADKETLHNAATCIQRSWRSRYKIGQIFELFLKERNNILQHRAFKRWNQHVWDRKYFRKKCDENLYELSRTSNFKIRERAQDHLHVEGKYGMAKWYHNRLLKCMMWKIWLKACTDREHLP
uniref:AlNc14C360G10978 protein n=1 Tax=Albugo laibachii Nc14 TaxID=890382 RepID=F0WXP3_9STRA|nr:AlNc14C360G10978 [Albugo laibachii Nc14]|eukprot:CCA26238.1 AlNc14C360G10978 [Albugo laibachii Nc14]